MGQAVANFEGDGQRGGGYSHARDERRGGQDLASRIAGK
jgi:hypothetical protein